MAGAMVQQVERKSKLAEFLCKRAAELPGIGPQARRAIDAVNEDHWRTDEKYRSVESDTLVRSGQRQAEREINGPLWVLRHFSHIRWLLASVEFVRRIV